MSAPQTRPTDASVDADPASRALAEQRARGQRRLAIWLARKG